MVVEADEFSCAPVESIPHLVLTLTPAAVNSVAVNSLVLGLFEYVTVIGGGDVIEVIVPIHISTLLAVPFPGLATTLVHELTPPPDTLFTIELVAEI